MAPERIARLVRYQGVEARAGTVPGQASTPAEVELGFEEFFRGEYRAVVRALVLVTGDLTTAEELAQEAFARAFERWGRVGRMASPAGYVYRTALNLNRSRLRRAALGFRLARHQSPERSEEPDASQAQEVRAMLRSLPQTQREALMLVEWLGYPAEQAAAILGVRPASVRGRLHRARRALRERFGGDDA